MAVIEPLTPVEKTQAFLLGDDSSLPSVGAGSPGASTVASPAGPPSTTQPTTTTKPTGQPAGSPPSFGYGTGSLANRLTSPVHEQARETATQLGGAQQEFYQAAGPERTYGGTGAAAVLRQAAFQPTPEATQSAQGLLGAQYTGPERLDLAGLESSLEPAQARVEALYGPSLAPLIQGALPGTTPGEARFDARRLSLDSAFRARRDEAQRGLNDLYQRFAQAQLEAQQFAQRRQQQEADIARKSMNYLSRRRDAINEDLARRMAQAQAQNQRARDAFEGFAQAPSYGALQDLPGDVLAFDPKAFSSPGRQGLEEAARIRQRVLSNPRYEPIKDLPVGTLRVSKSGKERVSINPEGELGKNPNRGAVSRKLYKLALERFADLENDLGAGRKKVPEPGRLSAISPLYYDLPAFEPEAVAPYLRLDPGVEPTREGLSRASQRDAYNRIGDLLGEVERLDVGEPYRAAKIAADVDRYLANEEQTLASRRGKLNEQQKAWEKTVKRARRRYKKAKEGSTWGKIAGVAAGAWLPGVGGPLGPAAKALL